MKINLNDIVLYVIIPAWVIAEIWIVKWMYAAKPSSEVSNKYPKKTIRLSQFPFGSTWKRYVDHDDVDVFMLYQKRIRVWYFSVLFFFIIFIGYIFIAF